MRKIRSSSRTSCSVALSSRAEATSVPNGFSTTTAAPSASPVRPSICTRAPIVPGGIDR
jgi:hypothetical protein